jgi:hypothetical protein
MPPVQAEILARLQLTVCQERSTHPHDRALHSAMLSDMLYYQLAQRGAPIKVSVLCPGGTTRISSTPSPLAWALRPPGGDAALPRIWLCAVMTSNARGQARWTA